jgi:UPF0176 protein
MKTRQILNIAAYHFVRLDDPEFLRQIYRPYCRKLGLRGTIIFSSEGINVMLAGVVEDIRAFQKKLSEEAVFSNLIYKESYSDKLPFTRMLVKVKPQIIPLDEPGRYDPLKRTANHLPPQTFKAWLDAKRDDLVVLDVRNDYEVRVGAFETALDFKLDHFREFPEAVDAHFSDPSLKEKTVVMYCTGGVRCEKASIDLLEKGFKSVYQLDGGILAYFEQCGGAHYRGDCFVFDYRVALDPNLEETKLAVCFECQNPLSEAEQASPDYKPGISCPYCIHHRPVASPTSLQDAQ